MMIAVTNIQVFFNNIREKGFFHLLSANILIQIFAFASQLFVAGILSPEDVGRIKIIQTYLSIFSVFAGMGFNASTLKICSENRSKTERSIFLNSALIFTIISSLFTYGVILLINSLGLLSNDSLIKLLIPLGLFPVVSNSIFMLFIAYFQSIKEIKVFSKLTILNKFLSIIGIIILTYIWGIRGYYVAYNLSFVLMILVAVFTLKKMIVISIDFDFRKMFSAHWKYSKSSVISNIVSELSAYLDIILISFFIKDMQEIGYYSFALTMTIALRIIPVTVQQITTPYFSSFINGKSEFMKLFKRYNRLLYIVVISSLILFLIFAPPLLHSIFNGKYDQSFIYIIFLSVGWSIRNLIQLQSGAIFGLGKIHYNAYTTLFTLGGNLIIYPISMYFFGIMGAAYASITSGLIIWFASRYYFRKAVEKTTWKI